MRCRGNNKQVKNTGQCTGQPSALGQLNVCQPPLGAELSANPTVCANRTLFRFCLHSEDPCVCSTLNREDCWSTTRHGSRSVSNREQGHVCSSPTQHCCYSQCSVSPAAQMNLPRQSKAKTRSGPSWQICLERLMKLLLFRGALRANTDGSHLAYCSTDAGLTGQGRNLTAIKSWCRHSSGLACATATAPLQQSAATGPFSQL